MKKLYTYTIHLPDGTHVVTPAYPDLIRLRKGTMALLTSLDMEAKEEARQRKQLDASIKELIASEKAFVQTRKATEKERIRLNSNLLAKTKKPLGSNYAYVKQWRLDNPEKYAEAKANEKLRKAGLLPDVAVLKAERKKKKQLNQLAEIKDQMFKLRGSASIEYSRLNKKKKALEVELGLK